MKKKTHLQKIFLSGTKLKIFKFYLLVRNSLRVKVFYVKVRGGEKPSVVVIVGRLDQHARERHLRGKRTR